MKYRLYFFECRAKRTIPISYSHILKDPSAITSFWNTGWKILGYRLFDKDVDVQIKYQ